MNKSYTSRSAVLTHFTCPRKRFLQYHYGGHGVVSGFLNLDLSVGSCVHRGLQHLLEHCRIEHPSGDFEQKCIDEAVEHARALWLKMCDDFTIKPKGSETVEFIIFEQMSLIEALIRAFAIYRLPTFLEQYEVLEVEKEEVYEDFSSTVTWLGKADGLLRNKLTNDLVVLSIKTASTYYEDTILRNILHDMQGVSEIACIRDRLQRYNLQVSTDKYYAVNAKWAMENPILHQYVKDNCRNGKLNVSKVQYEYLIKGQYRKDSDGCYKTQNTLIHPLKKDPMRFFSSQNTLEEMETEYKWLLPAGKTPKHWSRINIWEDMGVDNWIAKLVNGEIQPEEGNALFNFIKTPNVVNRTDEEIEEWKISTKYLEQEIARKLGKENNWWNFDMHIPQPADTANYLAVNFPKNTMSCHDFYGGDCTFVNTCHSSTTIEEGLETGFYQIRTSHHELEKQMLIEKGVEQK